MKKIPRIIFNFNDKCLNGCPFCFIPFDGQGAGKISLWREILSRAYEFSPEMISFSGCDPFYYSDFYELLLSAEKKCYWGVDSSLVWLDRARFKECAPRLDQISTSLDDLPKMPVYQRYDAVRLKKMMSNFDYVLGLFPKTVVHTLYSKKNDGYLEKIADELFSRGVRTWSLYQFWPFDFIKNVGDYQCEEEIFKKRGEEISAYCDGRLDFDYVPYKNRANGYFFVSSTGKAYTTLDGAVGSYKPLGSIFDEDIWDKWQAWSNPSLAGKILGMKIGREIK